MNTSHERTSSLWTQGAREQVWQGLNREWDIVIVGGGITGAAVLHEATQRGWRALLVEERDFAWGASSRSSKLVHGGLRYLKEGKLGLVRSSAVERRRLLDDFPELIEPLGFSLATYAGDAPPPLLYSVGLSAYDLLAGRWQHKHFTPLQMQLIVPHLRQAGLTGGFRFEEAITDDARLVLEVIYRAVTEGATAINYVRAEEVLRSKGRVVGVQVRDTESDRVTTITASFVVNATGAWADQLRAQVGGEPRIRPLRGSHLVLPAWRLPIPQAISKPHPWDARPVFALPWQGATIVGTTDKDHDDPLNVEPSISPEESSYLLAFLHDLFPSLRISHADVLSTFAGVRPVIDTGKADPSKESRDHVIWEENGLVTVTGGKLTTFRPIARDTLSRIEETMEEESIAMPRISPQRRESADRSGAPVNPLASIGREGESEMILDTSLTWADLRWAAANEAVVHLDDLLLRRTRIGILLESGGREILGTVKQICTDELGWENARWNAEEARYLDIWEHSYCPLASEDATSAPTSHLQEA